jgi:hypothetical protein
MVLFCLKVPQQCLESKKVQRMKCLDYYFQQKCYVYFLRISDSCEVLIPPETTHNLCENFAVWRELA